MKNKVLSSLCLLLFSITAQSQWTNTNFSVTTSAPTDIIYHNNTLIATYAVGLKYSTDDGNNWTQKSTNHIFSGPYKKISQLFSTGKYVYLFVSNLKNNFSTLVFRSDDDFLTFEIDTIGLQKEDLNNECVWLEEVYYADGYFYAHTKADGSWIKPVEGNWQKATKTEVDGYLAGHNNKLYSSANKFSVSSDYGTSWSIPANNNYPNNFIIDLIYIDKTTGRIYAGGLIKKAVAKDDEPALIYTNDEGANWTMITILPHLKINANLKHIQQLRAIYAEDDILYLGFQNDSNYTPVELFRSYDGGNSFVTETKGLYKFANMGSYVDKFLENNGTLIASVNGVYRRDYKLDTRTTANADIGVTVYPNPATDKIYLNFTQPVNATIELYTTTGQKVEGIELNADNSISVANLAKGMYILKVKEGNTYIGSQIFIKE